MVINTNEYQEQSSQNRDSQEDNYGKKTVEGKCDFKKLILHFVMNVFPRLVQILSQFTTFFENSAVGQDLWVKKSIIWVEFKIIFCLLYKQASFTTFLTLTQRTNFFFNMGQQLLQGCLWLGRKTVFCLSGQHALFFNELDGQFSPPALSVKISFRQLRVVKYVCCLIIYCLLQKVQVFCQGVTIFQFP